MVDVVKSSRQSSFFNCSSNFWMAFSSLRIDHQIRGIEIFAPILHLLRTKSNRIIRISSQKRENHFEKTSESFAPAIHSFGWVQLHTNANRANVFSVNSNSSVRELRLKRYLCSAEQQTETCSWPFPFLSFAGGSLTRNYAVRNRFNFTEKQKRVRPCDCRRMWFFTGSSPGERTSAANIIRAIYSELHQLTTPAFVFGHCAPSLGPDSAHFLCDFYLHGEKLAEN